jgi:nucleoside 2-deoxyribosyltransferase
VKAYLAGPDVFLPNAIDVGRRKIALCRKLGITAYYPLDNEPPSASTPRNQAFAIAMLNEDLIRKADVVLANLTPFRSPSVDPGTAYEIGFARALGKRVFGYTSAGGTLRERTAYFMGMSDQSDTDKNGHAIENFGLIDNLMIDGAIHASGGIIVQALSGDISAMEAFEHLIDQLRAHSLLRDIAAETD